MRKVSKLLITTVVLTVMFAVFAFSANAADYSGTWTTDITLNDGDTIGANGALVITAPITITVDGTVTVKDRIEIGNGSARITVNIQGDNAETDILLADAAFPTSKSRIIQIHTATLNVENITIDGNGVGVQAIMGHSGSPVANLNRGTVITGAVNSAGALYGWGTYNINEGASVTNPSSVGVGLGAGATLNLKGGSITAGSTGVILRDNTSKVNVYGGTITPGSGKSVIANYSDKVDGVVTVYKTWATAQDVSNAYTYWTGDVYAKAADKYIVSVTADIEVDKRVLFGGGVPIEVTGKNIGTEKTPVYPTISRKSGVTMSTSFVSLYDSGKDVKVTLSNITFDANGWTGTLASPVRDANSTRVMYVNPSDILTLNSGAVLTGGYAYNSVGGGVSGEGTIIMNAGSCITGNISTTTGGGINIAGNLRMNGGSVSKNRAGTYGGGIRVAANAELYAGTVSDNMALSYGGGIYAIGAAVVKILDDGDEKTEVFTISGNTANRATPSTTSAYGGGGILTEVSSSGGKPQLIIEGVIITGNSTSQSGGGIALLGGSAIIDNAQITNNTAANNNSNAGTGVGGGGIYVGAGSAVIKNATITDNEAKHGGGVYIGGGYSKTSVAMENVTITGNEAKQGGGIYGGESQISLTNVKVTGNTASDSSAGLRYGSYTKTTLSGATEIIGNKLTNGTESNINATTGFNSYDNEVYANNPTAKTGWFVIGGEFTGKLGITYPKSLYLNLTFDSIKIGVIAEGGSVADEAVITSDDGYFTYADGTDKDGVACATLVPSEKVTFTLNLSNGTTKTYEVAKYGKYALPEVASFGYNVDNFLGYVEVENFGKADAKIINTFTEGKVFETQDELTNIYAVWVKVDTVGAAAKIGGNSGLMFATKVDVAALENIGIPVKGYVEGNTDDGFYRGMLLGTAAKTGELTVDNNVVHKRAEGTEWLGSEWYKAQGKELTGGEQVFTLSLKYNNPENYNKVVTYRGYIAVTIGGEEKIIYADYDAPETLVDGDQNDVKGGKNARTARAVVRATIFETNDYGNLEALTNKFGKNTQTVLDTAAVKWDSDNGRWMKTDVIDGVESYAYWDEEKWVAFEIKNEVLPPETPTIPVNPTNPV